MRVIFPSEIVDELGVRKSCGTGHPHDCVEPKSAIPRKTPERKGEPMSILNTSHASRMVAALSCVMIVGGCAGAADPATAPAGSPTSAHSTRSHGGRVADQVSFIDGLRARAVTIEIVEPASQPFLRPTGTRLRLSGGALGAPATLEAYNYDDTDLNGSGAEAAKQDADQIQPDGMPKTSSILWVAPPHFFRAGRLVVLYVGSDPTVQWLLTDLLGAQFAGR
jgi:hypothetical protein